VSAALCGVQHDIVSIAYVSFRITYVVAYSRQ
jgi:hypothetical protein